jgi:hypothetical protein
MSNNLKIIILSNFKKLFILKSLIAISENKKIPDIIKIKVIFNDLKLT